MPKEPQDNTRVVQPIMPVQIEIPQERTPGVRQQVVQRNPDQLWDADKIERYRNLQNFYNNNFWGYGVFGTQTNYNPYTPEGQAAIQANFDYAKSNVQNFAENLLLAGAAEGVGQVARWATTPVKIGEGAEAVVTSAPLSSRVTKVTSIPRAEMHLRNTIPNAIPSTYRGTVNGLSTYTQPKIRILSGPQWRKALGSLERAMAKEGWRKITHPNLQGPGFTNGRMVVSDLGPGNIGRDLLGRVRLSDFAIETLPNFRLAMQRKGGRLNNRINNH